MTKPTTDTNHYALWLVPIGMLVLALLNLPYGYYTLLRIIVCGCCGYLAYKEYEIEQKASFWVLVLGAISLLFNPLIPIHLGRDVWAIIDPSVALILSVHIRTEFRKRRQITKMK